MDKELARRLLPLVNDLTAMGELTSYIDSRIANLKELLVTASDLEKVHKLQGAIGELRKFYQLRDQIISELENERKERSRGK